MKAIEGVYDFDVPRTANMLNVSAQTVRRLIEVGVLRAYQLTPNGKWWIQRGSVVRYAEHLAGGGSRDSFVDELRREESRKDREKAIAARC